MRVWIWALLLVTSATRTATADSVAIEHDPLSCIVVDQFARIDARVAADASVARARACFKAEGTSAWYYVDLKRDGAALAGLLPAPLKTTRHVEYYIEILDPQFAVSRTAQYAPEVVADASQCKGKLAAVALAGARLMVGAPAGAPPIPPGFAPTGITPTSAATSEPGAKSGGGHKGLLIGVGVAAVAGGVALAAGGGGDSPSSTTPAATATIASVSPSGTALAGATVLTFTAAEGGSASWDFGDGASASGRVATHVYAQEGTFQVTLKVASAQATASVPVRSLTGTWDQVGANDVFTLRQSGATLSGQDVVNGQSVHSVASGKVSDVRNASWDRIDNAGGGGVQDKVALTANDTITQLIGTFTHPSDGSIENVTLVRR